jgi:hypothetical protein
VTFSVFTYFSTAPDPFYTCPPPPPRPFRFSPFTSFPSQSFLSPLSTSPLPLPTNSSSPLLSTLFLALMADLYPSSFSSRSHPSYHRHTEAITSQQQQQQHQHQQQQQQFSQLNSTGITYPPQIIAPHHSGSSNSSSDEIHEHDHSPTKSPDQHQQQHPQKSETKPQATFLTKLYASVFGLFLPPRTHTQQLFFFVQFTRASGKSPYDPLGSCR